MNCYFDTSVLVPLFVLEPRTWAIREWSAALDAPLTIGRLAIIEFGSAIARKRRAGELDEAESRRILTTVDDWLAIVDIVEHEPGDLAEAAALVRRPNPKLLPADAIHLATARRLGLTLVTDDEGLQEVATFYRIAWLSPG